jgi:cell division protein FtsL
VYQLRRETAVLMREREMLRRQNAQLREEIRLLNTPEYIERIAREQLGLIRPDEMAIILVRPTPAPPAPAATAAGPEPEAPPWWKRLLRRRPD